MDTIGLDYTDKVSFNPGAGPMDSTPDIVVLTGDSHTHPVGQSVLSLDGTWQLAENGDPQQRIAGCFEDAIDAVVPGGVHMALEAAGIIPDPKFALNYTYAREKSFSTWWYKRTFAMPDGEDNRLVFDGAGVRCSAWLNGVLLGTHEGMFGGPEYDVQPYLQAENTLVVKIEPAPCYISPDGRPNPIGNDFFTGMNVGWMYTVTFNNVYGWHYSDIPSIGIHRSVRVEGQPAVKVCNPFITAVNAENALNGTVDLSAALTGNASSWSGTLYGTVEPDNFTGSKYKFSYDVSSTTKNRDIHLRFTIPEPQLWWPNDIGSPNLYSLKLSFVPAGEGENDFRQISFGIRSVEMQMTEGVEKPENYHKWMFVINGRPMFAKGSGWCTMDSSMDFSTERYDRLLTLAKEQHVQMLRAWGAGMPETDTFFDICNRYGIMIIQEWPTAWNSQNNIPEWEAQMYGETRFGQPYSILEETVRLNMLRLRNNPCLVMWGGGNEGGNPFGDAIDMMGRYAYELDGTRPFHRQEGWGGSGHDYTLYWGLGTMDQAVGNNIPVFMGEWGSASAPNYESVMRYLPEDEKNVWPPPSDGSFVYHTPVFNQKNCFNNLLRCAKPFMQADTMKDFIWGSQMAQVTLIRRITDRLRANWPKSSGALHYKLNDNYPAASWATVDWYGIPKMSYYLIKQTLEPLHAVPVMTRVDYYNCDFSVPIYLFDDADFLKESTWEVKVRAYNCRLELIKAVSYTGSGSIGMVSNLGMFTLTAGQTATTPLIIVTEVSKDGILQGRVFDWVNYEQSPGCILNMEGTTLGMSVFANDITVTNTGDKPAVAVHFRVPAGGEDAFYTGDNYFWLDSGESRTIKVNDADGVAVDLWNSRKSQTPKLPTPVPK